MALVGYDDAYALLDGVYNAMYHALSVPIDGTSSGGDLDWEVMCDTRLLVERDGDISGALRDKWLARLYQGTPREAYCALNWLEQLREPTIDPLALATSVVRHFKRYTQSGDHDSHGHYLLLYQEAASAVIRMKHAQAAKLLVDVFWEDQESLQVLRANSTDCLVVQLLLIPPSDENAISLGVLLGSRLETRAELVDAIAKVPGDSVQRLIWRFIDDPERHGVDDTWTLEALWRGLAARNDPDLVPYLQAAVLEPDEPVLGVPVAGKIADLKATATKYCLAAIPQVQEQESVPLADLTKMLELLKALDSPDRVTRLSALFEAGRILATEFAYVEDQPRALNDAAMAAGKAAIEARIETLGGR